MTRHLFRTALLLALVAPTSLVHAQQSKPAAVEDLLFVPAPAQGFHVLESAPLESIALVRNAAFYADAVTEFTQILGDGNRIERRYVSSIARDSRGRTRREEEIALVGALAANGPTPKLVTIVDPDARVSFTLDENQRIAHRNGIAAAKLIELSKVLLAARTVKPAAGGGRGVIATAPLAVMDVSKAPAARAGDAEASTVVMEALGTKIVEGVKAEGTRTTSTIPAGAIGNLMPIAVVTERWFSPELHMAVLITRRDPRSGETVYRLSNIVRAEPHDSLFSVPSDYEVRDGKLGSAFVKKLAPKK